MSWKASRSPVTMTVGTPSWRAFSAMDGDDVVGLVARHGDVDVAEGVHERLEVRPLLLEQVGPRGALGLVLRVDLLAPARPRVPHHHGRLLAVLVSIFTSMEAKPKMAFVGKPVDVAMDSGSAKKRGRPASCRR
jgi:hypothetical protein